MWVSSLCSHLRFLRLETRMYPLTFTSEKEAEAGGGIAAVVRLSDGPHHAHSSLLSPLCCPVASSDLRVCLYTLPHIPCYWHHAAQRSSPRVSSPRTCLVRCGSINHQVCFAMVPTCAPYQALPSLTVRLRLCSPSLILPCASRALLSAYLSASSLSLLLVPGTSSACLSPQAPPWPF